MYLLFPLIYVPGGLPCTLCLWVPFLSGFHLRWEVQAGDQRARGMKARYLVSCPGALSSFQFLRLPLQPRCVNGSGAVHYPFLASLNLKPTPLLNIKFSQIAQIVDAIFC